MTRVLIADDQELVRTGFRLILDLEPDMEVVGEAADGAACVRAVAREDPDVVLMDVRMPQLDGIGATRALAQAGSRAREQLLAAIRQAAAGEALLAPSVTRRLIERFVGAAPADPGLRGRIDSLSAREREVLALVAQGRSNAEIARALFIGDATVKTHVARMLAKLGARDRIQAVVMAYESRFVTPQG